MLRILIVLISIVIRAIFVVPIIMLSRMVSFILMFLLALLGRRILVLVVPIIMLLVPIIVLIVPKVPIRIVGLALISLLQRMLGKCVVSMVPSEIVRLVLVTVVPMKVKVSLLSWMPMSLMMPAVPIRLVLRTVFPVTVPLVPIYLVLISVVPIQEPVVSMVSVVPATVMVPVMPVWHALLIVCTLVSNRHFAASVSAECVALPGKERALTPIPSQR